MLYSPCFLLGLLKSERTVGASDPRAEAESAVESLAQFIQSRGTVVDPVELPVEKPEQKLATATLDSYGL